MSKSFSRLVLASALLAGLAACETAAVNREKLLNEPHYWQRAEASSAIYQRGPKAQQMLNRDISRCVTEIRELKRLGAIRRVTPAEMDEYGLIPPEAKMKEEALPGMSLNDWDTPERDGYMRAEHLEFHDFETCMIDKGWERIDGVPYDIAEESRENYIDAIIGEHYQTQTLRRTYYMEDAGVGDYMPND